MKIVRQNILLIVIISYRTAKVVIRIAFRRNQQQDGIFQPKLLLLDEVKDLEVNVHGHVGNLCNARYIPDISDQVNQPEQLLLSIEAE